MKAEGRATVRLKGMNAKRQFILLCVSLGLAVCVALLDVYIVRELLLFVACAAGFLELRRNAPATHLELREAAEKIANSSVQIPKPRPAALLAHIRRCYSSSGRSVLPWD